MVKRQVVILFITHFYAIFIAVLLYLESWNRLALVLDYSVPAIIGVALLLICAERKLNRKEWFCIRYYCSIVALYHSYCLISIFQSKGWVENKNVQVVGFIVVTSLFYIFKTNEHK